MKIFVPSWNGDFRLEPDGDETKLVLHQPTPHEVNIVNAFLVEASKKKWHDGGVADARTKEISLKAPLAKASKLLIKLTRPKKQTLTAVSFSDGKLSVIEGTDELALDTIEKKIDEASKSEKKEKPAAAASVRRPTPSCPSCEPGAIGPASEVLLTFLDDEQHRGWADRRAIVVTGGESGHRYMLAHRHSTLGQKVGRICYDLDDEEVIHFHDRTVPPEEEVLAAKLILENREPWLRNEATIFGSFVKYKNPFGDDGDGIESAMFTARIGAAISKRVH